MVDIVVSSVVVIFVLLLAIAFITTKYDDYFDKHPAVIWVITVVFLIISLSIMFYLMR